MSDMDEPTVPTWVRDLASAAAWEIHSPGCFAGLGPDGNWLLVRGESERHVRNLVSDEAVRRAVLDVKGHAFMRMGQELDRG